MLENPPLPLRETAQSVGGMLLVETGSLAGQRFLLPGPPGALLLGRESHCNVRFDPEKERLVGRTHASIEVRAAGVYLVDLSSANGTFLNGAPLVGEAPLEHGARFQLGGEGGPWIAVQLPVAVHIVPPRNDAPTLIRMGPTSPAGPGPSPAALPPAPVVHSPPPIASELRALPLGNGHGQPASVPTVEPLAPRAEPSIYRPDYRAGATGSPSPPDSESGSQRGRFLRQLAIILALLVIACSIGLGIGLRPAAEDELESSGSR